MNMNYIVVRVCQHWEHYLLHKEFILHTDHLALRQINLPTNSNRMHARWFTYISAIKYLYFIFNKELGKRIKYVVDALSKRNNLLATLHNSVSDFEQLKELYSTDEEFSTQWVNCSEGVTVPKFKIHEGFLFYDHRLCIPKCTLRIQLIKKVNERVAILEETKQYSKLSPNIISLN